MRQREENVYFRAAKDRSSIYIWVQSKKKKKKKSPVPLSHLQSHALFKNIFLFTQVLGLRLDDF